MLRYHYGMTGQELEAMDEDQLVRHWGHLQYIRQEELKNSMAASLGGLRR